MGASDASSQRTSARLVSILACALPCLASCAQVTGLSDDYRYDLTDQPSTDGGIGNDAGDGGGATAGSCSPGDRMQAAASINSANGSTLPARCASCLAGDCCGDINVCAADDTCNRSMQCVFNCQRQGNKQECVARCDGTFLRTAGSCVQTSCMTLCQLQ
ncbi:MAG: hypothetical protein K0S65_2597 [Labilithrix sp.]|nr:hypothetical protein [Labilithrix sp.]